MDIVNGDLEDLFPDEIGALKYPLRQAAVRHSGTPHILQIVGSGGTGGGTVAVLALAKGLLRQGFEVTLASDRDSHAIHEARGFGAKVLELDFSRRRSTASLARALGHYIRTERVWLSHAHGARAGLPLALLPASRRNPSVYTVHGFHYPSKPAGLRHLARAAERLCMARLGATVFVSHYDQELAFAHGLLQPGHKHFVIYNGADAPALVERRTPPPRFDIAFLGRLQAVKNPMILADVLLALRPATPTLAIIGGGNLESALRKRITAAGLQDQVTFFGDQPHAEGLKLLRQARVMLLPSLSEGLPISVIEAMHLAIPTVASRVGGIPELIEHGRTG
ncbi:MAG TPA: glycosyltransferase family 4 protein, partial [Rhodopila sp.]|nr:glycosyltransferase family 4 protein [Rhodopila sp.]